MPRPDLRTKRVYDPPEASDGRRVLVDRLWPRGISKEKANLDAWVRSAAPSDELRKSYCHVPERWGEFLRRYHAELDARPEIVAELREAMGEGCPVTLLFAAKETEQNNATALRDYLLDRATSRPSGSRRRASERQGRGRA